MKTVAAKTMTRALFLIGALALLVAFGSVAQAASGEQISQTDQPDPATSSCIAGTVWYDGNHNGIKEDNEDVMDGARVDLFAVGPFKYRAGNLWRALSELTRDGGSFEFCKLSTGNYFLQVDPPEGVLKENLVVTTGSNPSPIIAFEKDNSITYNFGFAPPRLVEGTARLPIPPR